MNYQEAYQADSTRSAYKSAMKRMGRYCEETGQQAMPCTSECLAAHLSWMADKGLSASTIAMARTAVDHQHKVQGHQQPGKSLIVEQTLQGINRTIGIAHKQKQGITAKIFTRLIKKLGNDQEHFKTLVIIAVMRDGMLRVSELCALRIDDFTPMPDGSGRMEITRSKTDKFGEGATQYLSVETTHMLVHYLAGIGHREGYIFGTKTKRIYPRKLSRAIKKVLFLSGIDPTNYGTHSARIGMTQDLVADGQQSVAVAQAGRWKGTNMVLSYSRNQRADQSAVAQYSRGER